MLRSPNVIKMGVRNCAVETPLDFSAVYSFFLESLKNRYIEAIKITSAKDSCAIKGILSSDEDITWRTVAFPLSKCLYVSAKSITKNVVSIIA